MSKWIPTLRRMGCWLLRKTTLAVLASLLFMISFTLFQYASWWPTLTDNAFLVWGGSYQGDTFAELALPMLELGTLLGTLFWPLFLLIPRPLLLPLFAGLWLWQTYDLAFMTATASTWLPHEIIWTFILPHTHWLLLTLLAPLLLIRHLGKRLFAAAPATQSEMSRLAGKP
ncbi:hypothetical protein CF138_12305 [Aeromonas hydrophila]|uniref:hypothetical protein n=1 Tax=Aeromonas hydrophila TaxID=644 RepID=UPI00111766B0|nr:hypothetical protein [Aeromonas hydrophila]TNH85027.1 hypothetical protein CF138_12305 [Aeromonas hydrophila]TNH98111.1 hypothetical protein CF136_14785 [Aeromonas hydrophila]TNI97578.1 hypothetical protein CF118_07310 [Aeromonas hydrophila]